MDKKELMKLMFDCYKAWISKWEIISEEARENEEMFDAFIWSVFAKKFCMPSTTVERRQLHSEKWFEVRTKEARRFFDLLEKVLK